MGALTILACLIFVVAKGTVQSSQFTELIPLQIVLTLRNGGRLNGCKCLAGVRGVIMEHLPSQ